MLRCFLAITLFATTLAPISAGTRGQFLKRVIETNCADGLRIVSLNVAAEEDAAVNDDARYEKYKEAARLSYRCSVNIGSGRPHDWYLWQYANDLILSSSTYDGLKGNAPIAARTFQELATRSLYADVRDAAKYSLGNVRSMMAKLGISPT